MNFSKLLKKFPRIYLLSNTVIWFLIGMALSCVFMMIPFLNNISFLSDGITLAGWLGMMGGFIGGIYVMLNDTEKY
jgi:hypothetical protein